MFLESLIGKNVFIRTVSFFYVGRLVSVDGDILVLEDAAWVAETARWSVMVASGELSEVEPYTDGVKVGVGRMGLTDIFEWRHPLPRVAQ